MPSSALSSLATKLGDCPTRTALEMVGVLRRETQVTSDIAGRLASAPRASECAHLMQPLLEPTGVADGSLRAAMRACAVTLGGDEALAHAWADGAALLGGAGAAVAGFHGQFACTTRRRPSTPGCCARGCSSSSDSTMRRMSFGIDEALGARLRGRLWM